MTEDPKAVAAQKTTHEGVYDRMHNGRPSRWANVPIISIREPIRDEQDIDFDPYFFFARQHGIGDGGD